jgi:hypothetical protein
LQAQSLGTSIQLSATDENLRNWHRQSVAVDDDCLTGLEVWLMRRSGSDSEDRTRTEWLGCKKQTLTDWLVRATKERLGYLIDFPRLRILETNRF